MSDREIINFTNEMDLDKEISNGSVLLCFYADWCTSCKSLEPNLNTILKLEDKLKIIKLNAEDFKEISIKYEIDCVPTCFFFEKGKQKGKVKGNDIAAIMNMIGLNFRKPFLIMFIILVAIIFVIIKLIYWLK